MWIGIGITLPIALLQLRWPNGGGTPTTQTNPPSEWYKIHHVDLLKSTSPHYPTTSSLLTTTTFASHNPFTNQPNPTKWPSSRLSSSPPWPPSPTPLPRVVLPMATPRSASTPSPTVPLAVTARSSPAATAVRTSSASTA